MPTLKACYAPEKTGIQTIGLILVILDVKKDDPIHSVPNIEEPLEAYFRTPEFLGSFKKLTVSNPEEQEEANRTFSASLTPSQRMEYLYYLQKNIFC